MTRTDIDDTELARSSSWADLPAARIEWLIQKSRDSGWRQALEPFVPRAPFFVKRMLDLSLLNWTMLLFKHRDCVVADVGSGFGSGVLGLASSYTQAVGVEFLRDRAEYAALRAKQETSCDCRIVRGTGHALPFADASLSLVTLNGVLEWAGLYETESTPIESQLAMLREIQRVLTPDGTLAVAIENRFAAESLLGLKDTHSQLTMVTAMPRCAANLWSRLRKREEYRTYLYSHAGYHRLFGMAGFKHVRLLDLISSYNDYDFVVSTDDTLSYRFLHGHGFVRSFYRPAAKLRRFVGRIRANWLGRLSYSYLVLAGPSVCTVLNESHPVWDIAASWGLRPAAARFACKREAVGGMTVVTHDGNTIGGVLQLSANADDSGAAPELPAHLMRPPLRLVGSTVVGGRLIQGYRAR